MYTFCKTHFSLCYISYKHGDGTSVLDYVGRINIVGIYTGGNYTESDF
jgi:hypothetical protein